MRSNETKVPGNENSTERKFHRTFVPGSEKSWERKGQGAKAPGSELVWERKGSVPSRGGVACGLVTYGERQTNKNTHKMDNKHTISKSLKYHL